MKRNDARPRALTAVATVALATTIGCSNSDPGTHPIPIAPGNQQTGAGQSGAGLATFGPPLTPASQPRLYVIANGLPPANAPIGIQVYAPPYTSASVPAFTTPFIQPGAPPDPLTPVNGFLPDRLSIAPDGSVALFSTSSPNLLGIFSGKLTATSVLAYLPPGPATYDSIAGIAYDSRSALWLLRSNGLVERFAAPVTARSVPDFTFAIGFDQPSSYTAAGIAIGPDDTVIVTTKAPNTVFEYPKPYGLVPTVVFPSKVGIGTGFAVDALGSIYAGSAYYQGPLTTPLAPNGGTNGPPPPPPPVAPTLAVPFPGVGSVALSPTGDVFTVGVSPRDGPGETSGTTIQGFHRPFLPTDRPFVAIPCLPAFNCFLQSVEFGP